MFDTIDLHRYARYKRSALAITILVCVLIAVYVNAYLDIDRVYTHIFYIPIILAGLWYHRKAVYVAIFFGLLHVTLDYYALGVLSQSALLRGAIFITIALVIGTLSEIKDSLNDRVEESNKKLDGSYKRLSNVIEFYPNAMLITDKNGVVTAWNKAMEDITGVTAADMIGKGDNSYAVPFYGERQPMLLDLVDAPDSDLLDQELAGKYERVNRNNGKLEALTRVHLRGDDRVLMVTASRLYDGDGSVAGYIESFTDITAQRHAEESLKKARDELDLRVTERTAELTKRTSELMERTAELELSKVTLQAILNTIQVGVIVVQAGSGKVTYFTRGAAEILNGPVDYIDFTGRSRIVSLFNSDGSPMCPEERLLYHSLNLGETISNREIRIRRNDGAELYLLASSAPIKDIYGRINAAVASFIDISELKRADMALRESREDYRTLIENINDLVWEMDENMAYTYASPRAKDILGYEPEEMLGRTPCDFMYPDEAKRYSRLIEENKRTGKPFSLLENTMIGKEGRHVVFETSGSPILDEQGNFRGFRGINRDVTGHKRAEKALLKSEVRARALASVVPNTVLWISKDGTFQDYKTERESDMFLPPGELMGKNIYEALPIELAHMIWGHVDKALKDGSIELFEYKVGIGGQVHYQKARCVSSGKDEALMVIRDLTDQKQLEQALEKAYEEREKLVEESTAGIADERDMLQSILDSIATGVMVIESSGYRVAYFNKGVVEIFGGPVKSLTKGRRQYKLMTPDGAPFPEDKLPFMLSLQCGERASNVEIHIKRYDGMVISALFSSTPIRDPEGKIVAAALTIADITH
ncbi:MAG TPA: PAS domain S-box protein [Methanocellaceae archaeon]